MSTSELTDFDEWLHSSYALNGAFTVFVVLVEITETMVTPLCSTYFHVIGTEMDWSDMTLLLAGAGRNWQGVALFADPGGGKGPLDNVTARVKLQALEQALDRDRLHINTGDFFDTAGRRMKVEEITRQ